MSRQLTIIDATAPQAIHSQLHLQRARHHLTEAMHSLGNVARDFLPPTEYVDAVTALSTLTTLIDAAVAITQEVHS